MPNFSPPSNHTPSRQSAAIDLQLVKKLFDRTERVSTADFLRREVAMRMYERLDLMTLQVENLLDAGCGAGADLSLLQERYPQANITGIDLNLRQLAQAQQLCQQAQSGMQRLLGKWLPQLSAPKGLAASKLVCGDFAELPVANGGLDMLWSNLALHWHPQADRVLQEWWRSLRPEGLLMFSCFGPDTFRQLRTAMQVANLGDKRILPFVDMHDLGDMMVAAGFAAPVIDMEIITVTYSDIDKFWADLRAFGGNPMADRPRGLVGRKAYQQLLAALPRDTDGKICLSFEIIYGHAFRPVARKTTTGEAIIQFQKRPGKP